MSNSHRGNASRTVDLASDGKRNTQRRGLSDKGRVTRTRSKSGNGAPSKENPVHDAEWLDSRRAELLEEKHAELLNIKERHDTLVRLFTHFELGHVLKLFKGTRNVPYGTIRLSSWVQSKGMCV